MVIFNSYVKLPEGNLFISVPDEYDDFDWLDKEGLHLMPPFVSISFGRSQLFFFCVKEGPSGVGNKRFHQWFHQWFHKSIMEPGGREDFSNRNILAMYFSNRNIETWLDYMENLPVRYTVVIWC